MVNLTKEATIHLKNVSQIDETIIDEPTSRGVDNIQLQNYKHPNIEELIHS